MGLVTYGIFGDGAGSSIESNPSYTYSGLGEFIVNHTVTDDCGNTSVETNTVIVEWCALPSCPCPAGGINIIPFGETATLSSLIIQGILPAGGTLQLYQPGHWRHTYYR